MTNTIATRHPDGTHRVAITGMGAVSPAGIGVPVLIAVGSKDEIAGSASALGRIIPGAELLDIPNRDHMRAVGDKVYKTGVVDFLSRRK